MFSREARAVQALHSKGIVHRDPKPENLVFASAKDDLSIKVTDFGLVLIAGEADPLRSVDVVGSPGYVAPEILTDKLYQPSNDVWSLGWRSARPTRPRACCGKRWCACGSA